MIMTKFKKKQSTYKEMELKGLELTETIFNFDKKRVKIKGKAYYGTDSWEYDFRTTKIESIPDSLPSTRGGLYEWAYSKLMDHITVDEDES